MNQDKAKQGTKVGKIVLNVFFYAVLVLLVLFSFANMKLKQKDDIANLFGRGFVTVLTDSMTGDQENSFTVNDVIFVRLLDEDSRQDLQVGDIVTYFSMKIPGLNIQGFITHRIIEIFTLDDETFIVTQGDKDGAIPDDPINITETIAVYTGQLKGAGRALKYLQTPTGFAVFVILPVALILMVEAVFLVRNIIQINNEKLKEKFASETQNQTFDVEAEKERIRQQILEEMKKQDETKNKA
jgi:signal peptidase